MHVPGTSDSPTGKGVASLRADYDRKGLVAVLQMSISCSLYMQSLV